MSRRGLLLIILASAVLQIGLVTAGRFGAEPRAEGHALPDKMWQTRLYFPLHLGDETIAPPRVLITHFPGPLP